MPSPSSYDSNTKLLNLLYSVSRELRSMRCFPQQKRTYSFTTSASDSAYALPTDFYSGLIGTHFDQTSNWQLVGPTDDTEWNYRLYGPGASSSRFFFRAFGPQIDQYSSAQALELNPTPSDTRTISYEYISKSLFYQSGWTPTTTVKETASASTDIAMFDDEVLINGLTYRYRESRGLDFSEPYARYKRAVESAKARWSSGTIGSFRSVRKQEGKFGMPSDGGWT